MNQYAVFLRGINVGGNTMIDMSSLKQILAGENNHVETYLNSGNLILETKKSKKEAEEEVKQVIEEQFNLSVAVFVKSKKDLENIVADNPFDAEAEADNAKRMVVMFHESVASDEKFTIFKDKTEDADYYLKGNVIYIYYKEGAGRAKISNPIIKQLLKQVSTSRNWNTITKMLGKME